MKKFFIINWFSALVILFVTLTPYNSKSGVIYAYLTMKDSNKTVKGSFTKTGSCGLSDVHNGSYILKLAYSDIRSAGDQAASSKIAIDEPGVHKIISGNQNNNSGNIAMGNSGSDENNPLRFRYVYEVSVYVNGVQKHTERLSTLPGSGNWIYNLNLANSNPGMKWQIEVRVQRIEIK